MDTEDKKNQPARVPRAVDSTRRKPLKVDITEVDREILRLLIRRTNMLNRMRDKKGRVDPAEEKFLRESWQEAVAKVSRDAALSGHFFTLMQEISFLPRPGKTDEPETELPGAMRRQAFNLAPPRLPVAIDLTMPRATFSTSAWMYLAAAHGSPIRLNDCLLNDGEIDLLKALNQVGAALNREEGAIVARHTGPLEAPDKVIHLGDSFFNFYLLLAHYLGRPSRVKFSGDSSLKLADLSFLKTLLPECGARLVHVVPKSNGLPARLEATGVLPAAIKFTAELPPLLACAFLLAATSWSAPFGLDLEGHPQKAEILARTLPILENAGAVFTVDGSSVSLEPSSLTLPAEPQLPVEPLLCVFLLAFTAPLGGKAHLRGVWPEWPGCENLWRLARAMGLEAEKNGQNFVCEGATPAKIVAPASLEENLLASLDEEFLPLPIALAACASLLGQNERLPKSWPLHMDTADYLHALGLEADDNGTITRGPQQPSSHVFNAPAPYWAVALALAAMGRGNSQQVQLGNPGIMTSLWPGFWAFYNGLPAPKARARQDETVEKPKNRRRIRTEVVAVPPEIREEDWD